DDIGCVGGRVGVEVVKGDEGLLRGVDREALGRHGDEVGAGLGREGGQEGVVDHIPGVDLGADVHFVLALVELVDDAFQHVTVCLGVAVPKDELDGAVGWGVTPGGTAGEYEGSGGDRADACKGRGAGQLGSVSGAGPRG